MNASSKGDVMAIISKGIVGLSIIVYLFRGGKLDLKILGQEFHFEEGKNYLVEIIETLQKSKIEELKIMNTHELEMAKIELEKLKIEKMNEKRNELFKNLDLRAPKLNNLEH